MKKNFSLALVIMILALTAISASAEETTNPEEVMIGRYFKRDLHFCIDLSAISLGRYQVTLNHHETDAEGITWWYVDYLTHPAEENTAECFPLKKDFSVKVKGSDSQGVLHEFTLRLTTAPAGGSGLFFKTTLEEFNSSPAPAPAT